MPDPHNRIGYSYACCDIMGLDINILATREQSLFLSTVCRLAVVHPLLAERRKNSVQTQGRMGIGSEISINSLIIISACVVLMGLWCQESQKRGTVLHRADKQKYLHFCPCDRPGLVGSHLPMSLWLWSLSSQRCLCVQLLPPAPSPTHVSHSFLVSG